MFRVVGAVHENVERVLQFVLLEQQGLIRVVRRGRQFHLIDLFNVRFRHVEVIRHVRGALNMLELAIGRRIRNAVHNGVLRE